MLRPGGLLVGVWFISPHLDPGEEGPPFAFPVPELTALFADGYEIVEDYVPDVSFETRVGQERVRVLRRAVCDESSRDAPAHDLQRRFCNARKKTHPHVSLADESLRWSRRSPLD